VSPWEGEVSTPFPIESRVEPLNGVSHHGPRWEQWLTTRRVRDDGGRTVFEGEEAQAAESVGDELDTPKVDDFTRGENIAW
jgi:hypothetical protein